MVQGQQIRLKRPAQQNTCVVRQLTFKLTVALLTVVMSACGRDSFTEGTLK
jgi:hypothetical protein